MSTKHRLKNIYILTPFDEEKVNQMFLCWPQHSWDKPLMMMFSRWMVRNMTTALIHYCNKKEEMKFYFLGGGCIISKKRSSGFAVTASLRKYQFNEQGCFTTLIMNHCFKTPLFFFLSLFFLYFKAVLNVSLQPNHDGMPKKTVWFFWMLKSFNWIKSGQSTVAKW